MANITWNKALALVGKNHEAAAYVVLNTANGMPFVDAYEDQNLYGDRADIVAERELAIKALKSIGINVK